jgi:NAD-dependent deacetylase
MRQAFEASQAADVFLVVGTSALVYPAAALPEVAQRNGAFLIEVNPEETPLSHRVQASVRGTAAETLPNLLGDGEGRTR